MKKKKDLEKLSKDKLIENNLEVQELLLKYYKELNKYKNENTPASVNSIITRVAQAANSEYEDLKKRIATSPIIYVDETSFSVLGKNQWVWVFKTDTELLLVIRPSRGSDVLREILGDNYSGTIICDCWRAYDFLKKTASLQRCWAHLIRKSEKYANIRKACKIFHNKLYEIFIEIKEFNLANTTQIQREKEYERLINKLKKLTNKYSKYDELKPVLKYIGNNLENWFTCIKKEGIEPTNNFAEQAIRETVIVRKIIGAFRSENGKENYETLASLIATWQLKKLDLKIQLRQMLKKKLMFLLNKYNISNYIIHQYKKSNKT